ncbi:hypothetical protein AURDEDRAFT_136602 [Auricularia subglabra TFB-10046 SS5]|nr:hypothetical protein AURDEDRAFT_136602 [Auricularia subglabra TFB-10046 SS5]
MSTTTLPAGDAALTATTDSRAPSATSTTIPIFDSSTTPGSPVPRDSAFSGDGYNPTNLFQSTAPTATQPDVYAYALTTTLFIRDFQATSTGIPTAPSYLPPLADGSLLTPLYTHAQRDASVLLFSCALFGIVFVRNIAVSYRFVRRIAARDMTLFYMLLFSQVWGPIACAALLIPLVSKSANCTAVNVVAAACAQTSYSILISGILGVKAYRCLNRSNAVLAAILLTQFSAWVLIAFDFPRLGSMRTLADICVLKQDLRLLPTAFIMSSIETLIFVAMCFGYAVWNASKRSAQLGRISLDLSTRNGAPSEAGSSSSQQQQPRLRGWWDYAPNAGRAGPARAHSSRSSTAVNPEEDRTTWRLFPFPRREIRHPMDDGWEKVAENDDDHHANPQRPLTGWTNGSGASPKFARMVLLNDAVRNELYYTSLILLCHTVAMIMVPISSKNDRIWPPIFWIGLSWTVTSVLVIQSFSQVVSRHEREAILREPALPGWGVPDTLDAPTGPPRPKQTPWGRAVSFSTNSVFTSATSPTHPHGAGALSRRPSVATTAPSLAAAAVLWANTNPFSDAASVHGPPAPEVWRRGSVSGMSQSSAPSTNERQALRAVPHAYAAPGQPFALPPMPERRGSNASSGAASTSRTTVRKGSAESLLLR